MARNHKRPVQPCAPITPDIVSGFNLEEVQKQRIAELSTENRKLQKEVAYLKMRHETIENALARQLHDLQKTIANMMAVFEQLDKPLVQNPLKAVKR